MNTTLSRCLQFRTAKFDYNSELPAEYNAGNRFYGRDVAEFVSEGLSAAGMNADFLDEDWGWLVQGTDIAARPFEVAIYNLSEHGEGARPGVDTWGLWVRAYESKKVLRLFSKRREVTVPHQFITAIEGLFTAEGIRLQAWSDGPQ